MDGEPLKAFRLVNGHVGGLKNEVTDEMNKQ